MEIELEMGGFYTCFQDDFEPVVMWIGRVDLPDDLGGNAVEPVVSVVLRGAEPEMPIITHAPFWESAALDGEMTEAEPFEVNAEAFDENYNTWRSAYEGEEAYPWAMTPNEVYAQMMGEFLSVVQP
ncbi:hypothetical protein [Pseudorhodobacter sp.]|uniref:hypothetical protein n=1 Tax=Pseudorhodobacter sp. TaxID=1934400 RepID=UPI00264868B3|nr:hypothetical protein [Pseudorhodobacter sp.]MDN5788692.1 hypothetical protein [Pseudorhodobacter sp.]